MASDQMDVQASCHAISAKTPILKNNAAVGLFWR
jgi:hypothetical protein